MIESQLEAGTPLINLDDFKSFEYRLRFENLASQKALDPEILEVGEKFLVLDVPSKLCAHGHLVKLEIEVLGSRPKLTFTSTAKVTSSESQPLNRDRIYVTLVQYDKKQWQELCRQFSSRQGEINHFIEAVKGY